MTQPPARMQIEGDRLQCPVCGRTAPLNAHPMTCNHDPRQQAPVAPREHHTKDQRWKRPI